MDDRDVLLGEEDAFEDDQVGSPPYADAEIRECFAIFDQKNTGLMATKYVDKALRSLGINLTNFEVNELIEAYEKDGFIEFPDFHDFTVEKMSNLDPAEDLKQSFAVFDPDGEGVIPTNRFKKWMMTMGDKLTESEAKDICKMGDPAKKGLFVYDDVIPQLLN